MRNKILLAVAAVLVVAVASTATASAASQVNVYGVTGSIKGGKKATKKAPKPISLVFNYTVGEQSGLRPSVVTNYAITFGSIQVPNNTLFKGCDVKKLNAPTGGLKVCPAKSIVGHGLLKNATGKRSDPSEVNPALACNLHITLVNSTKRNHLLIWLNGQPGDSDVTQKCAIAIHQAIDGTLKGNSKGTTLSFRVADNLLHPLAGLDNSVIQVGSSIVKQQVKKGGKTIGFFQSTGCKTTQPISVQFTQEAGGLKQTKSTNVKCS